MLPRFRLLLALLPAALLAPTAPAQPVFDADAFRALYQQPHTVARYGIADPAAFAPLTRLTGGPHVFDLSEALLVGDAGQEVTPTTCAPAVPGCAQPHLASASLVLRARENGDVFFFHDLTDAGFFQRGWAGQSVDEAAGATLEGALTHDAPDRTLALPLYYAQAWTSAFATEFTAGDETARLNTMRIEREVVSWGTLRTAHGEASVLVVMERRVRETGAGEHLLRDTTEAYRLVSPYLRATLELSAAGVESGVVEVYTRAAATASTPEAEAPAAALLVPQPNPARGAQVVQFTLGAPSVVTLDVYDGLGRRVARLFEGMLPAGTHAQPWEEGVAAGVYFVHLQADGRTLTRSVTRLE